MIENEKLPLLTSVVQTSFFLRNAEKRFGGEEKVDELVDMLARNPRLGKKISQVNSIFKLGDIPGSDFDIYYFYESKRLPLVFICSYRKGTKDVLSKVLSALVEEIVG